MIRVQRHVDAPPDRVWAVLADGWLYPLWVVGASSVRDVEEAWPAPGSRIHHSVGAWPALVHDSTRVEEAEPERSLRLRAGVWPAGEADVRLTLTPEGSGTLVVMEEEVASGPMSLIPKPVYGPLLKARNVESTRRLANLAQNGAYRRHG
ncbi:SRPBCC family protein [Nocardioides sp. BP30]|uniref:SRPBCC family protein n=1 Tax=Nocardioides sp. BP30 TaxID=3036374 RepID=UPI0024692F68|nr:SRPBCC family protein [Nocardioides sp. BP30]WGL53132.1 SRPBCC family protein [Nocardioides sp. BP30]